MVYSSEFVSWFILDPSTFNTSFTTPIIKETTLNLSEQDFENHISIQSIKKQCYDLNFSFQLVSTEYIKNRLLNVNEKKTCRPDGITPKLLKTSAPAVALPLTNLSKYCIDKSTWPSAWKQGDVTPAYKKDEVVKK